MCVCTAGRVLRSGYSLMLATRCCMTRGAQEEDFEFQIADDDDKKKKKKKKSIKKENADEGDDMIDILVRSRAASPETSWLG